MATANMKRRHVTAAARVQELVREHGSLRKVEAVTGVSRAQLGQIAKGRYEPRIETLSKLKLSRVAFHEILE